MYDLDQTWKQLKKVDANKEQQTEQLKQNEQKLEQLIKSLLDSLDTIKACIIQYFPDNIEIITLTIIAVKSYIAHKDLLDSINYIKDVQYNAKECILMVMELITEVV